MSLQKDGKCSEECEICKQINTRSFKSKYVEKTYNVEPTSEGASLCNTSNIVYLLTCKCGVQYVGQTERELKKRMGEHSRKGPIYRHLREHNSEEEPGFHYFTITIIKHNSNWSEKDRLTEEKDWMMKLITISPYGLNAKRKSDGLLQILTKIKDNQSLMMERIKKIEESLFQEQKKTHEPENTIKQEPQAGDIPNSDKKMKDTKLNKRK